MHTRQTHTESVAHTPHETTRDETCTCNRRRGRCGYCCVCCVCRVCCTRCRCCSVLPPCPPSLSLFPCVLPVRLRLCPAAAAAWQSPKRPPVCVCLCVHGACDVCCCCFVFGACDVCCCLCVYVCCFCVCAVCAAACVLLLCVCCCCVLTHCLNGSVTTGHASTIPK